MKVYATQITRDMTLDEIELQSQQVSKERREKIKKLYYKKDKISSLYAELLLRHILVKNYGISKEKIHFRYNSFQKPFLAGFESELQFNISHSGDWIVCAISKEEVGIDIQKIGDYEDAIAKRFYNQKEYLHLHTLEKEEQIRRFYQYWSLKESYVKAVGKGLSIPLDELEFIWGHEIVLKYKGKQCSDHQFECFTPDIGYTAAVCVSTRENPWEADQLEIISEYDFFGKNEEERYLQLLRKRKQQ